MYMKNGAIRIGETNMDYISFGKGEKPLVVIPGLGDGLMSVKGKAQMGSMMYPEFAEYYRVYLFSRKQKLEHGTTTRSMAADLAFAMNQLGIANAHVVGVSLGGMIAQFLAAEHPELVDRLVLVVTLPKANEILTKNLDHWMKLARNRKYKPLLVDIAAKSHPPKHLKKYQRFFPLLTLAPGPRSYENFLCQATASRNHDGTGVLRNILAKTLVIGGERDETVGAEGSRQLVDAIPNSYLCIYHNHGHGLYQDARDFNERIVKFLK